MTLRDFLWDFLRNFPFTMVGMERPRSERMTVHTGDNSFTGEIEMKKKSDKIMVGIKEDDGSEYAIPYESVEYFEEAEPAGDKE